jgi:hypothetical protein
MAIDEGLLDACARLCWEAPLYSHYPNVRNDGGSSLSSYLTHYNFQFDGYCVFCERDSTFKTRKVNNHDDMRKLAYQNRLIPNSVETIIAYCQRQIIHEYFYIFHIFEDVIVKFGQFPSMETIANSDMAKFRQILGKQYFSELHRAGGLMSHDIGIGAFVYLRRIFERLLATHREEYEKERGPIEGYDSKRVDEKIDALKSVLPETLVRNRAVYGILSKGLHELDEDTCKKFFPILKAAIIAILEEDYQTREKKKAADELTKAIAAAAGEIKGAPP